MSQLSLVDFKQYLRVVHDDDDPLLLILLRGAEQQAMRFLGTNTLYVQAEPLLATTSSEFDIPEDVEIAVYLIGRADYEAHDVAAAPLWRDLAYEKLFSYRRGLGV